MKTTGPSPRTGRETSASWATLHDRGAETGLQRIRDANEEDGFDAQWR